MNEPKDASDMGLETLLSVARDVAPEIPEDLIRKVFTLQRVHQFDTERDVSLQEFQRIIDEYVGPPVDKGGSA